MENAITYAYDVSYNGVDITKNIQQHLISLTYRDHTEGKCDELEILVEDTDGLWANGWYPAKGAQLVAKIGYPNLFIPCGTFLVDEIEMAGPPDTVTMKAVAAGFTGSVRTERSYTHEQKSLQQIVNTIAAAHGFTVTGSALPTVNIALAVQKRENDLCFLQRIAQDYGCVFSLRGNTLVFTNLFDLELNTASTTISRQDLTNYRLTDKSAKIYKSATSVYHSPATNGAIGYTAQPTEIVGNLVNADNISFSQIQSADTLQIRSRVESQQQAALKARSHLYRHNSKQQEMSFELPGNIAIMAGVNINLTGMGINSGNWTITESEHTLTRTEGYTTKAKAKRLQSATSKRALPTGQTAPVSVGQLTNLDGVQFSQIVTK